MAPRRQCGRLYELPLLGAILVVVGVALGNYHPAGFLLAALPIVLWLGLHAAALVARMSVSTKRRQAIRERLAALAAEGFVPALVCEGDLARGEAWAAFDSAAAKIVSAESVRSHELSRLGSVAIDEARRLGDPTPRYYSLRLYFGDPNARFQTELAEGIATTSRAEAERWSAAIAALRKS